MTHSDYHRVAAATAMLGRVLAGITLTETGPTDAARDELTPDVALDSIEADPEARSVSTVATTRSGDRYRITVAWLGDGEDDRG